MTPDSVGNNLLEIVQCEKLGYALRTLQNVIETDGTMAIAIDANTAGEILTRSICIRERKPYVHISYTSRSDLRRIILRRQANIQTALSFLSTYRPEKLNVAGNGLYTFKKTQKEIDKFVMDFFHNLRDRGAMESVSLIQTGGQTGVDEAAIKMALKLGYDARIVAPKGWMFRGSDGVDVKDEEAFKTRFFGLTAVE